MKSLKTLIKLHKQRLNEIIKQINKLEDIKKQLIISLDKLKEEAESELKKFFISDYSFMLDNYLKTVQSNKKKFQTKINQINVQLTKLQEQLSNQFSELKKFEIAFENRLKEQKENLRKAESKFLDEHGTTKFNFNKSK